MTEEREWEEAARMAGWDRVPHNGYFIPPLDHPLRLVQYDDWQELCVDNDIRLPQET